MRVLLLDHWGDEARAELAKVCEVVTFAAYSGKLDGFDGLIPALNAPMPALDDMPDLRFVASGTTGLDHIDLDYCKEHGIAVLSLQGDHSCAPSMRQLSTIALMLSLLHLHPQAHNDVCAGRWDREAWQSGCSKWVGLIGFGRGQGQRVNSILQGWCRRWPYPTERDRARTWRQAFSPVTIQTSHLLAACDIVCRPLNDSTRMIGERA